MKYPHRRKRFRTTIWKQTGIHVKDGTLSLSRARGLAPVQVALPPHLISLPVGAFLEARLVWDRAARHYTWHLVVEDGQAPDVAPGPGIAAVDLGEVHPAALTDGQETLIISCRALRSNQQYTAKRLSELKASQDRKKRGSRRWRRLQRRKTRFRAKQRRRARDLEHKISRAIVDWAKARQVGKLVVGDVRDVADGKRLNATSQQKIGVWSHGRQRAYLSYKAAAAGITVRLIDEAYTTQTCPGRLPDGQPCQHRYKPKGRVFACPAGGFRAHRDAVGCANILSVAQYGNLGQIEPPSLHRYRHPVALGKRSRLDAPDLAWQFR